MASETTPQQEPEPALERRLATILCCDVADYSRLMGANEEATVQALRGHRAVFDALLKQHHGRVFNTAGDAILAEFPSAVEAVRCATEIQSALQTRNEHLPPEQKMLFRMGINLGDVVVQGGDLLGDGVNVAARIQSVAPPGGICISGSVYDQIQNKLSLQFRPLGEQSFKNIGQPIRTFTITHAEAGALPAALRRPPARTAGVIAGLAIAAALLAGGGYWMYRDNEAKRAEEGTLTAQLEAQRKAAEEARKQADELAKRAAEAESKAERERLIAEATKREAALQAQLQSAEEGRRRAEGERKRVDEERQRAEAARAEADRRVAEAAEAQRRAAVLAEAEKRARSESEKKERADAGRKERAATNIASAAPGKSAGTTTPQAAMEGKFDGAYDGQMCNFPNNPERRQCWPVKLNVEKGAASTTWASRVRGKFANAQLTVSPTGAAKMSIDGWNMLDGSALSATLEGRVADNRLQLTGRWANGAPLSGEWTASR
jgi:class 3 adenylate cyclase